jgi:hypothetical protein
MKKQSRPVVPLRIERATVRLLTPETLPGVVGASAQCTKSQVEGPCAVGDRNVEQ